MTQDAQAQDGTQVNPNAEAEWSALLQPLLEPDAPRVPLVQAAAFLRLFAYRHRTGQPWDVPATIANALDQG